MGMGDKMGEEDLKVQNSSYKISPGADDYSSHEKVVKRVNF